MKKPPKLRKGRCCFPVSKFCLARGVAKPGQKLCQGSGLPRCDHDAKGPARLKCQALAKLTMPRCHGIATLGPSLGRVDTARMIYNHELGPSTCQANNAKTSGLPRCDHDAKPLPSSQCQALAKLTMPRLCHALATPLPSSQCQALAKLTMPRKCHALATPLPSSQCQALAKLTMPRTAQDDLPSLAESS